MGTVWTFQGFKNLVFASTSRGFLTKSLVICCLWGIILLRSIGIIRSHYNKDPYEPVSIMEYHKGFERCSFPFLRGYTRFYSLVNRVKTKLHLFWLDFFPFWSGKKVQQKRTNRFQVYTCPFLFLYMTLTGARILSRRGVYIVTMLGTFIWHRVAFVAWAKFFEGFLRAQYSL